MTLLNDSIQQTLDQVATILQGQPKTARKRAAAVAAKIAKVITDARNEAPTDPAVALGVAFGIFKIAEQLVDLDRDNSRKGQGLIHLLS